MCEDGSPDFSKKPKKVRVPKKSYWMTWREAETLNIVLDGFACRFRCRRYPRELVRKTRKGNIKISNSGCLMYHPSYPNIAISNRVYPEAFRCRILWIFTKMFMSSGSHIKKGTIENAMLKLALNKRLWGFK